MCPQTDEQLMVMVSKGDKQAFEILFSRYQKKLYNYILRFTGDTGLTEDIFQETFLKLYKYSPKYRPLAKFSTFLYRIATNLCINEMKRRKKFPTFLFGKPKKERDDDNYSIGEESIPSRESSPEDRILAMEIKGHLREALSSLPDQMRATLLLSEVEGRKYEEIAEILGCSVGTVKSRVNRCRTKLKEYFTDHEIL